MIPHSKPILNKISEALLRGPNCRVCQSGIGQVRQPAACGGLGFGGRKGVLLWWGVLDEFNALLNVALQARDASLEELLLLVGDATEDVDGLLRTVGL